MSALPALNCRAASADWQNLPTQCRTAQSGIASVLERAIVCGSNVIALTCQAVYAMTDSENDGVECLGNPSRPPKRAEFRAPVRASSNKSMNKRNGDSVECLKVAAQLEPSESIIPEPEAFNLDDFAEGARPVRPGKLSKQHQDGPAKNRRQSLLRTPQSKPTRGRILLPVSHHRLNSPWRTQSSRQAVRGQSKEQLIVSTKANTTWQQQRKAEP